ncbi:hypothetical protein GCM10027037_21340 [Mucilaginibacter koreensis]
MKHLFKLLIALLIINKTSKAQETVNGSFELKSAKGISRGWSVSGNSPGNEIYLDSTNTHTGKCALKLEASNAVKASEIIAYNSYGLSSYKTIATIEVSGWIKITHAADSAVSLFIQSLSGRQIYKGYAKVASSMLNKWQKVTIHHTVNSKQPWAGFYYGVALNRTALAWLDDVTVKVDGKPVADPLSLYYEPTVNDVNWLNKNLYPLASVQVQPSHADMAGIGKFCGEATVVGIGEPTHGTHEALQFKLRLLDYLVNEKGFNTIALEEVIPTCDKMNDVLNNNPVAIKDSLLSMPFYKLWKSVEMNELFAWISRYNQTHSGKVKLIGIDMEDVRIQSSRRIIKQIGLQHDPAIAKQVDQISIKLDTLIAANSSKNNQAFIQSLANNLKDELNKLDTYINAQYKKIAPEQLFKLKTYVRVCQQWLDTRFYNQSADARDRYMAENLKYYTDQHPSDKILVWAHNAHIANLTNGGSKMMGAWLKDLYGKAYIPIAFTSASGSYTAAADYTQQVWKAYLFETAYRGTYPYIFAKAKKALYFLSLNTSAVKEKGAAWLRIPMKQLDIPYIQTSNDEDYRDLGIINTAFDGVVFCKSTTASSSYLKQ